MLKLTLSVDSLHFFLKTIVFLFIVTENTVMPEEGSGNLLEHLLFFLPAEVQSCQRPHRLEVAGPGFKSLTIWWQAQLEIHLFQD